MTNSNDEVGGPAPEERAVDINSYFKALATSETPRPVEKPQGISPAKREKVDIPALREGTRAVLAKRLLWILSGTLVGVIAYIVWSSYTDNEEDFHREIITVIWTSQVTLVSGALGFYFGSQESGSGN